MDQPRHIILSGGARGLGLAIGRKLLVEGYCVSSFGRRRPESLAVLQKEYPDRFRFEQVDIADAAELKQFVDMVVETAGVPYGVINNSAIAVEGVLATLPEIEVAKMLSINLDGAIRLTRLGLRHMLKGHAGGRVINISSIVGTRGYNGLAVYSATKAGLDGFGRAIAREVGRRGITVNSIAPGYMRTEMSEGLSDAQLDQIVRRTPLGRLAEPEDIAGAVLFLLSDAAAFITGVTLLVDGGISS